MEQPASRPSYVAGELSDYLAITAGTANDLPVGILTFRPRTTTPQPIINLMVSRAALERLREDIDSLLQHSTVLKAGDALEVTLAEVEAIHNRLG